jgi:hypothetical protein
MTDCPETAGSEGQKRVVAGGNDALLQHIIRRVGREAGIGRPINWLERIDRPGPMRTDRLAGVVGVAERPETSVEVPRIS